MPVLPSPHLPVSPVDGAGEGVCPPAGHHVHELLEGDGRAAAGAPEHLPLLFKVKTKPNEAKKQKFKQSNDQFSPFLLGLKRIMDFVYTCMRGRGDCQFSLEELDL